MEKWKRTAAVISAAAIAAAGLTACKETKTATEGRGDVPTLKWVVLGDNNSDEVSVEEAVSALTEKEIGVKVDLEFIDTGAFTDKMNMYMASGSNFDLCFTGWVNPYQEAVQRGGFLDITDKIESDAELREVMPDYALDQCKIGGKIYGVPNMQIMTVCTAIVVQKDLADEFGLKPDEIKCLEDIEPFLKWVKENKPDVYPFRTGAYGGGLKNTDYNMNLVGDCVAVEWDDNGNLTYMPRYDSDTFMDEPELLWDWYRKGYIRKDVASVMDDTQDLNMGKYAVFRAAYKPGGEAEYNARNSVKGYMIKLGEQKIVGGGAVGAGTAISKNTKYPDKAYGLLKLVNTNADLINLLSFGIEGKHYTLDENGCAVVNADAGYTSSSWEYGNVFNSLRVPGQDEDVWEQTKKFNDDAIKSKIIGFVLDKTPIRTQLAQIQTVSEKYQMLDNGSADPKSYIEEYKSAMKTAGIEDVVKEVQKQIEEWEKTKNK